VARLFVSQERIDRWSSEGKVTIEEDIMSLPALGRSFRLRPAVYITRVLSREKDIHRLLGRVKTAEQLSQMGAENFANSLILGEVAYECEPGFVGEVIGAAGVSPGGGGISGLNH
jgi:hypothetical protein